MTQTLLKILIFMVSLALIVNIYFIIDSGMLKDFNFSKNINVTNNASLNFNQSQEKNQWGFNQTGDFSNLSNSKNFNDSESVNYSNNSLNNFSLGNGTNSQQSKEKCYEKFGISNDTIVFYYQEGPYSNTMIPIVHELEGEYDFYWTTELWNSTFNVCFGLSGTTPVFVCAGTKEKIVGEVSKEELSVFAERC